MSSHPGRWNKAKKIFAGWLVLGGLYTMARIQDGTVGAAIAALVVGLPLVLVGWWLWRSLPPWRGL